MGSLGAHGVGGELSLVVLQMFLRAGQMAELDKLRTEMMNKAAITIQRCTRGHLARIYFRQRKAAVITLQVPPHAKLSATHSLATVD